MSASDDQRVLAQAFWEGAWDAPIPFLLPGERVVQEGGGRPGTADPGTPLRRSARLNPSTSQPPGAPSDGTNPTDHTTSVDVVERVVIGATPPRPLPGRTQGDQGMGEEEVVLIPAATPEQLTPSEMDELHNIIATTNWEEVQGPTEQEPELLESWQHGLAVPAIGLTEGVDGSSTAPGVPEVRYLHYDPLAGDHAPQEAQWHLSHPAAPLPARLTTPMPRRERTLSPGPHGEAAEDEEAESMRHSFAASSIGGDEDSDGEHSPTPTPTFRTYPRMARKKHYDRHPRKISALPRGADRWKHKGAQPEHAKTLSAIPMYDEPAPSSVFGSEDESSDGEADEEMSHYSHQASTHTPRTQDRTEPATFYGATGMSPFTPVNKGRKRHWHSSHPSNDGHDSDSTVAPSDRRDRKRFADDRRDFSAKPARQEGAARLSDMGPPPLPHNPRMPQQGVYQQPTVYYQAAQGSYPPGTYFMVQPQPQPQHQVQQPSTPAHAPAHVMSGMHLRHVGQRTWAVPSTPLQAPLAPAQSPMQQLSDSMHEFEAELDDDENLDVLGEHFIQHAEKMLRAMVDQRIRAKKATQSGQAPTSPPPQMAMNGFAQDYELPTIAQHAKHLLQLSDDSSAKAQARLRVLKEMQGNLDRMRSEPLSKEFDFLDQLAGHAGRAPAGLGAGGPRLSQQPVSPTRQPRLVNAAPAAQTPSRQTGSAQPHPYPSPPYTGEQVRQQYLMTPSGTLMAPAATPYGPPTVGTPVQQVMQVVPTSHAHQAAPGRTRMMTAGPGPRPAGVTMLRQTSRLPPGLTPPRTDDSMPYRKPIAEVRAWSSRVAGSAAPPSQPATPVAGPSSLPMQTNIAHGARGAGEVEGWKGKSRLLDPAEISSPRARTPMERRRREE